jgi:hypothetical protein
VAVPDLVDSNEIPDVDLDNLRRNKEAWDLPQSCCTAPIVGPIPCPKEAQVYISSSDGSRQVPPICSQAHQKLVVAVDRLYNTNQAIGRNIWWGKHGEVLVQPDDPNTAAQPDYFIKVQNANFFSTTERLDYNRQDLAKQLTEHVGGAATKADVISFTA